MNTYTTRITLVLSNLKDYELLYKQLLRELGVEKVKKQKGYKNIPGPTEYQIQSDESLSVINQAVQRASQNTGKEYYFTLIREKETAGKDLINSQYAAGHAHGR